MKWQPIETAPVCVASSTGDKGLRNVLVTRVPATTTPPIMIARLRSDGNWYIRKGKLLRWVPTHWMPLPDPPKPAQETENA